MVPSAATAGAMLRPGRCSPHGKLSGFEAGLGGHGGLAPGTTVPREGTNWGSKLIKQEVGGLAGAIRSEYLTLETAPLLLTLTNQPSCTVARAGGVATAMSVLTTL